MTARQQTLAARIVLAVGAVAAVAWLAHARGGFSSLFDRVTLWALLPYALFFGASAFAGNHGDALALLLVCLVTTIPALLIYGATLLPSLNFFNTFIIVFMPLFQVSPAVITLAVLFFTRNDAAAESGAA